MTSGGYLVDVLYKHSLAKACMFIYHYTSNQLISIKKEKLETCIEYQDCVTSH